MKTWFTTNSNTLNEAEASNEDVISNNQKAPEMESSSIDNGSSSESTSKPNETNETLNEKTDEYEANYSEAGFWNKVTKYAKKAGEKALSPALKMYYTAQDSDTPTWAKTTIYGALGYFISPIDGVPDVTPVVGYTDDVAILAGAIAVVAAHIKEEHREKAQETLKRWFN